MKVPLTLAAVSLLLCPVFAGAQPVCSDITGSSFTGPPTNRKLKADCRTSVTIVVPTATILNGQGNTITAFDPDPSGFKGAVVQAAPGSVGVSVQNLIVDTDELLNVCDAGGDRLRGIMFDDASGQIQNNTVLHINQGASGCQEGNAIEVRNFTIGSGIKTVTVSGNRIYDYQKTGIVINGNVSATVSDNIVGASSTQANLAANGIQVGFGGLANLSKNDIEGNTWLGFNPITSNYAAAAVLLWESAAGTKVNTSRINLVGGNADVGIYVRADSVSLNSNRVYDWGPDVAGTDPDMDVGIYNPGYLNGGLDNTFTKNKVRCYQTPYDNVTGPSNTVLPCTDSTSTSAVVLAAAPTASVRPASPSPQ